MFVAQWRIEAKFGHKDIVLESMHRWIEEVGSQIGWNRETSRLLTGSIGAPESVIISQIQVENLAELEASWNKLGSIEAHKAWSKELEPHVVSGTNRWEVFRTL